MMNPEERRDLPTPEQALSLQLQRVGDEVHANKVAHGWTPTVPDDFLVPEKILAVLMLITTEVAEAAEEVREGNFQKFETELADILIRTIGLAHGLNIDLGAAITAKMQKNRNRPFKHGGKLI